MEKEYIKYVVVVDSHVGESVETFTSKEDLTKWIGSQATLHDDFDADDDLDIFEVKKCIKVKVEKKATVTFI